MDRPDAKIIKRRKRRDRPNKKWTDGEVLKIIDFLEREREFEKPTARIYYNNFLRISGVEANWSLVRFKVRYLKRVFFKAEAWRISSDAISLQNADGVASVIEKLQQMCPYYNRLFDVFGYMIPDHENGFIDTEFPSQDNASSSPKEYYNENSSQHDNSQLEFVESKSELSAQNRVKPNKKWTDDEVNRIINYIESEREFEKPTCRLFYTKFLDKNHINATWDLIKYKVRNLKQSFLKAEAWRKHLSNEASVLEADEEINEKLQRMCPFYNRLYNIFAISNLKYELESTVDIVNLPIPDSEFNNSLEEFESNLNKTNSQSNPAKRKKYENESTGDIANLPIPGSGLNNSLEEFEQNFHKNNSTTNPAIRKKGGISHLVQLQKDRTEIQKLKLEFDREKFVKEMEMRQQEIELKKEELQLRRIEIEKDERIRILEIEKDERIARLEIEMKYKRTKCEPELFDRSKEYC